jgi:hypothetical protein
MFVLTALLLAAPVFPGFTLKSSTLRGDYYVLATEPRLKLKPEKCDKRLAGIERSLGVTVPRFSYRRVKTYGDVMVHSRDNLYAGGVANPDGWSIIATDACSAHELAHLATFMLGRADAVTEEGVASMLGGSFDWLDRWNARQRARRRGDRYADAVRRLVADPPSVDEKYDWYLLADSWSRHLRSRFGMRKLAEYIRAQGTGATAAEAFRMVYGGELHAAFDRWLYGKKGPPKERPTRR